MAAIFFDIDGTLWDQRNIIPESTCAGIRELRENGHDVYICTGRTRAFVYNEVLLGLGFDGFSYGCGTHLEIHGEDVFYQGIEAEEIYAAVEVFHEYDMPVVVEGKDHLFMDIDRIGEDAYGQSLVRTLGSRLLPIYGSPEPIEGSKFSLLINGTDFPGLIGRMRNVYDFAVHATRAMEVIPKGFSKARGIADVCRFTGARREDTYAFGDSANDIAMLDYAGTAVVMGNGREEVKEHADFVTKDIHEDGVYYALRHFGLV